MNNSNVVDLSSQTCPTCLQRSALELAVRSTVAENQVLAQYLLQLQARVQAGVRTVQAKRQARESLKRRIRVLSVGKWDA